VSPAKKVDRERVRDVIELEWTQRRIANELGISHQPLGSAVGG
jgi:hypothetical protein